jgi:hypothetical protein
VGGRRRRAGVVPSPLLFLYEDVRLVCAGEPVERPPVGRLYLAMDRVMVVITRPLGQARPHYLIAGAVGVVSDQGSPNPDDADRRTSGR